MDIIEITTSLNKASFFILRGATLKGFVGKYPYTCKVQIEIERELLDQINSEKHKMVDYQKYMKQRSKIKLRIKKAYKIK